VAGIVWQHHERPEAFAIQALYQLQERNVATVEIIVAVDE
jgi:hypothetical protein